MLGIMTACWITLSPSPEMRPSQSAGVSASTGMNIAAAISSVKDQLWPQRRIHQIIGALMLTAIMRARTDGDSSSILT